MFEAFSSKFKPGDRQDTAHEVDSGNAGVAGYREFMRQYAGTSFNAGLYRVHSAKQAGKFDELIAGYFPAYKGRAECFGCDWLGRQFALDRQRVDEAGQPLVLMFEPGTGEVLEIPATFLSFHNEELVEYGDAALAEDFYKAWAERAGKAPAIEECVGYKVPLFLGGEDETENLEIMNMEVCWEISAQLYNKTRTLPKGATIGKIAIE